MAPVEALHDGTKNYQRPLLWPFRAPLTPALSLSLSLSLSLTLSLSLSLPSVDPALVVTEHSSQPRTSRQQQRKCNFT